VVVALDDDPEAMKFVLTALRFPHRPLSSPDYKLMTEVAALCDKYELQQSLQPVADRYFLPIGRQISNFNRNPNWLLISYVFGYEKIFAAVSKYIILRLTGAQQAYTIDCRTPAKVTGMARVDPPSASAIAGRAPFLNPDALAAKRNSIIDQLEYSLAKVRRERSVIRSQIAPAVRCLKQSTQKECEALQLGNLEGNLLRLGLPEDVRTKSVGRICDEVALFAPLSVDCVHQSNTAQHNSLTFSGVPHRNGIAQHKSTLSNVPRENENVHRTCSWVPVFKLTVSRLLSSEEGLKLENIPSSMKIHK